MRRIETHDNQKVFALEDSTTHRLDASFLLGGNAGRFPERQAGTLAEQFLETNRPALDAFEIDAYPRFDGRRLDLVLKTRRQVGAVPLKSPTTGDPDYGFVVKPRFGWVGIGPTLARTGWRVTPEILELPQLPKSDREIPPWVLSSVVLPKIRDLLRNVDRDFEMVERDRRRPRGRVDWQTYATRRIPSGRMLAVPCQFPDLQDDRELLSAIHFTLKKHRGSLQTQRNAGPFVQDLLSVCEELLRKVRQVPPGRPSERQIEQWMNGGFGGDRTREAVRAIQWTVDERGLAGLGELQGLPWSLGMETFFEAWIEHIAERITRQTGGAVRTGRRRETVVPLRWEPAWAGSQRALVPDVVLETGGRTVIFDAKYKRHFEEFEHRSWHDLADEVRETHRRDLLQVLAYANTSKHDRVTSCLIYPCRQATWESLRERGRVAHRAELGAGKRQIELVLAAAPLDGQTDEIAGRLGEVLKS